MALAISFRMVMPSRHRHLTERWTSGVLKEQLATAEGVAQDMLTKFNVGTLPSHPCETGFGDERG